MKSCKHHRHCTKTFHIHTRLSFHKSSTAGRAWIFAFPYQFILLTVFLFFPPTASQTADPENTVFPKATAISPAPAKKGAAPNTVLVEFESTIETFDPSLYAAPGTPANMLFSDLYKPLSRLRHGANGSKHVLECPSGWDSETYADLLSKDKQKQKEAIKGYLLAKIKNNWEFSWPPNIAKDTKIKKVHPAEKDAETAEEQEDGSGEAEVEQDDGYAVDSEDGEDGNDSDNESVYSVVSEDYHQEYTPRLDWTSDLSDNELERTLTGKSFDSKGDKSEAKRATRRRALREEVKWNEGLACFEARRDAWTGARTVRIRAKPPPSIASTSSSRFRRRSFFRHSISGSPPSFLSRGQQNSSGDSETSSLGHKSSLSSGDQRTMTTASTPPVRESQSGNPNLPVRVLIPIASPLLPPQNPLRASITPSLYLTLYDKLIGQSIAPACPINLKDMLRACVAGWQRDGEWPPKPTAVDIGFGAIARRTGPNENAIMRKVRRKSLLLLGKDRDLVSEDRKGIRRSLQRALGMDAT